MYLFQVTHCSCQGGIIELRRSFSPPSDQNKCTGRRKTSFFFLVGWLIFTSTLIMNARYVAIRSAGITLSWIPALHEFSRLPTYPLNGVVVCRKSCNHIPCIQGSGSRYTWSRPSSKSPPCYWYVISLPSDTMLYIKLLRDKYGQGFIFMMTKLG